MTSACPSGSVPPLSQLLASCHYGDVACVVQRKVPMALMTSRRRTGMGSQLEGQVQTLYKLIGSTKLNHFEGRWQNL
jgi:hypothetical protein